MQKTLVWFSISAAVFVGLVYYNAKLAQKNLSQGTPSKLAISILELPSQAKVGERVSISWEVEAPADFQTTDTTIFYSPVSTPSAVTKSDSPEAVGYQSSLSDYRQGSFYLPFTFDGSITFQKPGTYFLRAYSLVRGNHLWTDEKQITISK